MSRPDYMKPKTPEQIQAKIKQLEEDIATARRVQHVKNTLERTPFTMAKEEKIELARTLPELTESLRDMTKEAGFVTGTHVYGIPNGQPQDIDWVVNIPPSVYHGYCVGADEDDGYWESDGMSTLYGHYRSEIWNIICVSDIPMYNAWYMTTQFMVHLENTAVSTGRWNENNIQILKDKFKNKYNRVRVFRALKDVLYPIDQWQQKEQLPKEEALEHYKCRVCRQEAINFSNRKERLKYQSTGICERCFRV